MYLRSGIPKKWKFTFFETLKIVSDSEVYHMAKTYIDHIKDGEALSKGFYFYSEMSGNGKSTLAVAIANEVLLKAVIDLDIRKPAAMYVVVPEFLDAIKATFNDNVGYSLYEYMEELKNCKLLVLDDLGSEKPSEFTQERLYTVINYRYNENLPTIITSNLSLSKLKNQVGTRIVSRITEACFIYKFEGEDRRPQL